MPFFSIVVPLYNKEKFVINTLKSILNQSFTNFEIIIIDDGSTDHSVELISTFNDSRIQLHLQQNKGVSVARNKGITLAKAPYICFMDADDIWKPNHLISLYTTINYFPDADMICGRYLTQISKNNFKKNTFIGIADDYEGYVTDFFKASLINRVALTSAVCIKKDIYTQIGGFNPNISSGQDTDFWIRIALRYKIAITKEITLIYNNTAANKSLSKTIITNKKLSSLDQFIKEEENNSSLKSFLDVYRIEYALKYHISGNKEKSNQLLQNVNKDNIRLKTKLLFKIPALILKPLLHLKHYLKGIGFDFSVYN